MADFIYWTVSQDDQTPCLDFSIPFDSYLTPFELDRLGQMRFQKRRAEWLHGRWTSKYLFRHSAAPYSNLSPLQIQIKNEPEGMPFLENVITGERLPDNISISHREHQAFCAITHQSLIKLGVDLELVERRTPGFLQDFFTVREYTAGLEYNTSLRDLWFTLLWSLKEAVLKAVGKGLRLDTRSVEVRQVFGFGLTPENSDWQKVVIEFDFQESSNWNVWWRLKGDFVFTIAACHPISVSPPQLIEVEPCLPDEI